MAQSIVGKPVGACPYCGQTGYCLFALSSGLQPIPASTAALLRSTEPTIPYFPSDMSMGGGEAGFYFTRFRLGGLFDPFPSFSFFLFSTFSLKKVFFRLTALMMQYMMTAFSQSLVPSKCSILRRYFSLKPANEASSKESICSANFSRALSTKTPKSPHPPFTKGGGKGGIIIFRYDIPHRYDSGGESDLLLFCTDHNPCKERDHPSKPGNNNNQCGWDGTSRRPVLLSWLPYRDIFYIDSRIQRRIGPKLHHRPHSSESPFASNPKSKFLNLHPVK
jgi:hypothetical protein